MIVFICGAIMNIVEIVMYADLQERYEHKYNVYHAIHHIMAFLSILFYFFVPKNFIFQRPFLRSIRSYENFQEELPDRNNTVDEDGRMYTPSPSELRRFHMTHMQESYSSSSDLYKPEYHMELTKRIQYLREQRSKTELDDIKENGAGESVELHFETRGDVDLERNDEKEDRKETVTSRRNSVKSSPIASPRRLHVSPVD
jgi:hypothetical protein